jgi:hypothetical protein
MSDPTATEPASAAARIIDELLASGAPVDDGQFTLDPVAAAAKLEAFAYADRSLYLIPIIEGLINLGAREVALETVREDLIIRGRGIRLHRAQQLFTDIYSHAIGAGDDAIGRAFGRLAIGIDMLLGGEPNGRVRMCYSDPSGAVIGEYGFRAAPQISRAHPDVLRELSISIDHSRWGSSGRATALGHLRNAVGHSDRTIILDGETISGQPRSWIEPQRGEGPGYRFVAGFEKAGDQGSVIELWTAGVRVETLSGNGQGFRAVIEFDAPRRDLSRFKIVRDETVEQALAAVERLRSAAAHEPERPVLMPAPVPAGAAVALVPLGAAQLVSKGVGHEFAGLSGLGLGFMLLGGAMIVADGLSAFAVTWLAIGLLSLAPIGLAVRQAIRIRDNGTRTQAKITGVERLPPSKSSGPRGRVLWSFVDDGGTLRTGASLPRSSVEAQLWEPGERIVIYYHSDRPDHSVWEADVGPRVNRSYSNGSRGSR